MANEDNEILVLTDEGDCVGLHVRNGIDLTRPVGTMWQAEVLRPGLMHGLCCYLAGMSRDQADQMLANIMQSVDELRDYDDDY